MALPQEHLTLDQFVGLPETKPALEYENGRAIRKVSPKGKHSLLQTYLTDQINRSAVPNRLARAFGELRVTFGGRSYVPDVVVYRWDRIPIDPDGEIANDFFEAPDVAVEIVSPDQSVTALVRRCLWYVAHGVWIALLVDPADKSFLVFRPNAIPQAIHESGRADLSDIVTGLSIDPTEVFEVLKLR